MVFREVRKKPVAGSSGRFRTACAVMLDALAMPAAKTIQLYGVSDVSAPTSSIVQRTKEFKKKHKWFGRITEALSWTVIGFNLAYLGSILSYAMRSLGGTVSGVMGYMIAYIHPSLVGLASKKAAGMENGKVDMSRYFEASGVSDGIACLSYFSALGAVLKSGQTQSVSTEQAITAALASGLAGFLTYGAVFTLYWAKVVRQVGNGGKATLGDALKEAGAILGTSFLIWSIPMNTARSVVAAFLTLGNFSSREFYEIYLAAAGMLDGLGAILSGIKNTIVEKIIEKTNQSQNNDLYS